MSMDWGEIFKIVWDVAWKDGGRAILWMIVGGGAALLISIGILFFSYFLLKLIPLFKGDDGRQWGRRLILIAWFLFIPATLMGGGALWGLILAAEKSAVERELIEMSLSAGMRPALDKALDELEVNNPEVEFVDAVRNEEGEISLDALEGVLEDCESTYLVALKDQITTHLLGESSEGKVPEWLRPILQKHLIEGQIDKLGAEQILNRAQAILTETRKQAEGSESVTSQELCHGFSKVLVVPEVQKYAKVTRSSVIVGAFGSAATSFFIILALGALMNGFIWFVIKKKSDEKLEEAG